MMYVCGNGHARCGAKTGQDIYRMANGQWAVQDGEDDGVAGGMYLLSSAFTYFLNLLSGNQRLELRRPVLESNRL